MKIKSKFRFVEGDFDTKSGEIVCVKKHKYSSVDLCFKANMNIPFASIQLHSSDTLMDAQEVYEGACTLGDEIVRRWNESQIKQ